MILEFLSFLAPLAGFKTKAPPPTKALVEEPPKVVEDTRDIFDLNRIIDWVEGQPQDKEYDYLNMKHCLIAQYLKAQGKIDVRVHPNWAFFEGRENGVPLPRGVNQAVAQDRYKGWTFGGALINLKALRNNA